MRNVVAIILFLMSTSLFGQQTDTIGEYFLQPIEVQKDDNLWKLAERHYHDGRQYSKFWTVSKTKGLTNNPDSIYPGMVLYKLAKRTRLPSYHEEKFININTLLQEQNISLDSISEKLNNLKIEIKDFPCCVVGSSDSNWFVDLLIGFIAGVASSLFTTFILRRYFPDKKEIPVIYKVLFPLFSFITVTSIMYATKNIVIDGIRIVPIFLVVLLSVILIIILWSIFKISRAPKKQPDIKIPNVYAKIDEFYESISDWSNYHPNETAYERKRGLDYWINYWKIYGEDYLSKQIEKLRDRAKSLDNKNIESKNTKDIMEEITASLKAIVRRHQN